MTARCDVFIILGAGAGLNGGSWGDGCRNLAAVPVRNVIVR